MKGRSGEINKSGCRMWIAFCTDDTQEVATVATCPRCGGAVLEEAPQCPTCGFVPEQRATSIQSAIPWTVLAATGPLVLANSDDEYAVYDDRRTYGRWPKTPEGYRFASETYSAHSQSLVHGVAYMTAGYQDPARLGLPTDPVLKSQTYSAPLSYVGSTRRLIAWAGKVAKRSPVYAVLCWTLAIITMLLAWAFITCWYVVVFGLFGIFVIPYRLVRRSSRKSQHIQRTALATQQAMLQQQQAMIQQLAQQQAYLASGQAPPLPPPGAGPAPPPPLPPPAS